MIQAWLCGRLLHIHSKKRMNLTNFWGIYPSWIKVSSNSNCCYTLSYQDQAKATNRKGFACGSSKAKQCISWAIFFRNVCRCYVCERPRTCMYSRWVLKEGGRPCSQAGARRLVGLRTQHIHKSGLSGSCQRLHNEGHYSGRVSKLLSQGPVPGNHTHSAPC